MVTACSKGDIIKSSLARLMEVDGTKIRNLPGNVTVTDKIAKLHVQWDQMDCGMIKIESHSIT
jgi:hypothetical protein